MLGLSEEQAQDWQNRAEREFYLWAASRDADYMRQLNFSGLQKLAFHAQRTDGDCFVLLPWTARPGVFYDLRVQLIEADRVCNPNDLPDDEKIAGGIERDAHGVPVAIHIRTPHPGAVIFTALPSWKRIPLYGGKTGRRNALQLMNPERIDQSRGEPTLTPVIETLKQISRYTDAELMAAVVNAMLSVFIKRPLDAPEAGGFGGDENDQPWMRPDNLKLGSGTWIDGAPGEELQIINAARPSNQFDPFFVATLKQIGMGLGIPFEVLVKHFSSSYSASRAAMLAAEKEFKVDRDEFISAFTQPIYEEFLIEAVIKGRLEAPGFLTDQRIRTAYCQAYWIGTAQGQIDEIKEVEAANKRVLYGFSTQAIETAKLTGLDYQDVVRKRAEEKAMEARHGWSPALPSGMTFPAEMDSATGEELMSETVSPAVEGGSSDAPQKERVKSVGVDVQQLAMNGAQSAALQAIVEGAATGAFPKETAKAVIKLAFPATTDQQVSDIIDPIEVTKPAPPAQHTGWQ